MAALAVVMYFFCFDEVAYLAFKSIFHTVLKDGIIAICYLRKSQCFSFNFEC